MMNEDVLAIMAEQLKGINKSIYQTLGIVEPGKNAVYSSHDIARHWLSLPDIDIEDGYEGLEYDQDSLPEPKIAAVPPVYTPEEEERRRAFTEAIINGTDVHFRSERVSFLSAYKVPPGY